VHGSISTILERVMITKTHVKAMIVLNWIFLFLNVLFLMVGSAPMINLFASLFCLGGVVASYALYNEMK